MGSLYFCSVCGKPSDQEISHVRHEQYCRRRATTDSRPVRPKACHLCRSGKVKCDFKKPCSRCVGKGAACVYGKGSPDLSEGKENVELLSLQGTLDTFDDFDAAGDIFRSLEMTSLASNDGITDIFPFPETLNPTALTMCNPSMLVPTPFGATLVPFPRQNITPGCRQLIISTVRSFPRMMTRLDNLPPFVHHFGCQLHFDPGSPFQDVSMSCVSIGPSLLRPLSACMTLAQVFVSRAPSSGRFLWESIDGEHRRIAEEMQELSPGETLSSLQAMVIYTIMRLMDSGVSYFLVNGEMLKTNRELAGRFTQLCPGPFSPPHARLTRPTWEEWILEETRRRIVVVCFLLDLVAGSADVCEIFADPYSIPLPSSRLLWEAQSAEAWEREYDVEWEQLTTNQPRIDTVGDLLLAKDVGNDGAKAQGKLGGMFADALDDWHAGLDGLGMLVAAVVAET